MKHKNLRGIYWMAIIMGIFLPIAETVRRFKQLTDLSQFLVWFDDYILGAIMLLSAWMLKTGKPNSISYMIGAWGIGTGALFLSFLSQIDYIISNRSDPGGIFSVWFVLIAKGLIMGYMILGLLKSIKAAEILHGHFDSVQWPGQSSQKFHGG